ncbi:MAG: cobalamin-binding protein [Oligoflexia bacterium]|nr:cobalamin-binding protein [Oligoflexia bacterium]
MNMKNPCHFPERIICLTEESVELLYAIGEERRIIGVSAFIERPPQAKEIKRVCAFTSANIEKIVEMKPDLVLGYSDIQKDIAKDLVGRGIDVWIANHRSLEEMLNYCLRLGGMIGEVEKAKTYVEKLWEKIEQTKKKVENLSRFEVYLEEWDEPMISAIQYFSEVVELCGGDNIFKERLSSLAKDRFVQSKEVISHNPQIIFGCWCGKKVDIESIKKREGWGEIDAVKNNMVIELKPEIFLQPGPALIEDGIDILLKHFEELR